MSAPTEDARRVLPAPTAVGPLLPWLLDVLRPMNRTRVKQLLRHGRVLVNGVGATRHDHPLRPGDQVAILRAAADSSLEDAGCTIAFEDDALVVLDKPPGLLTVATAAEKIDTAFVRLSANLGARGFSRPYVVHRLDRETSGLLLFARTAALRDQLQKNWGLVQKTYLAVVAGKPPREEGVVENYLLEGRDLRVRSVRKESGGRRALTHYRVLAVHAAYSLVEVVLQTGRKHQIRVHMTGLGCPVIGDPLYGSAGNPAGRLGLHAHRLALDHPASGQRMELESPLPTALRRIVG